MRALIVKPLLLSITLVFLVPNLVLAGFLSSRAEVNGNDFLDWQTVEDLHGSNLLAVFGNPPSTIDLEGDQGAMIALDATAEFAVGNSDTFTQLSFQDLEGARAIFGVKTVFNSSSSNFNMFVTFEFSFDDPVIAFGADVSRARSMGSINRQLLTAEVFDIQGDSLGILTSSGLQGDDPTLFLGFESDSGIAEISGFRVISQTLVLTQRTETTALEVNQIDLRRDLQPANAVVPEPASLTLLGIGICGIAAFGIFRRRASV